MGQGTRHAPGIGLARAAGAVVKSIDDPPDLGNPYRYDPKDFNVVVLSPQTYERLIIRRPAFAGKLLLAARPTGTPHQPRITERSLQPTVFALGELFRQMFSNSPVMSDFIIRHPWERHSVNLRPMDNIECSVLVQLAGTLAHGFRGRVYAERIIFDGFVDRLIDEQIKRSTKPFTSVDLYRLVESGWTELRRGNQDARRILENVQDILGQKLDQAFLQVLENIVKVPRQQLVYPASNYDVDDLYADFFSWHAHPAVEPYHAVSAIALREMIDHWLFACANKVERGDTKLAVSLHEQNVSANAVRIKVGAADRAASRTCFQTSGSNSRRRSIRRQGGCFQCAWLPAQRHRSVCRRAVDRRTHG